MKPEFAQLYHEMIETNQATAVTFVCQQELDAAGVTGENRKLGDLELTKEQRNTCRKVAEFMQEEPNKTCIQGNYFALSLLLRAVWMNATGYRLMEKEGQKIQLLPTQWKEIRRISELCCEAAQSNTVGKSRTADFFIDSSAGGIAMYSQISKNVRRLFKVLEWISLLDLLE